MPTNYVASRDAFGNDGQNHHTGTQNMARLLDGTLDIQGHNNNSNVYFKATEYLNSPISVDKLAQRNVGNGRRNLQMHQTSQKPGMTRTT